MKNHKIIKSITRGVARRNYAAGKYGMFKKGDDSVCAENRGHWGEGGRCMQMIHDVRRWGE